MGREEVVIIGNGAAGNNAAEAIRAINRETSITIISEEEEPEYSPCVLYHYISGSMSRSEVFLKDWKDYALMDIKTLFGKTVLEVDPNKKVIVTEDGEMLYDKLILATGSRPFVPNIEGLGKRGVFTLKTLMDADGIAKYHGRRAVVIGSGPIGVPACVSLRKKGYEVTLVEALDRVLPKLLDREPSAHVESILRHYGINALAGERVSQILGEDTVKGIVLEKERIDCDMVILATGMRPNVDLARRAGIEIGPTGGIVVDKHMKTSREDVYACGDCVETSDIITGQRILNLKWTGAVSQGKVAGYSCVSKPKVYGDSLNMVILDLYDKLVVSMGWTTVTYPYPSKLDVVEHKDKQDYWRLLVDDGKIVGMQFIGGAWKHFDAVVLSMLKHIDINEIKKRITARELITAEPWRAKLQHFLR